MVADDEAVQLELPRFPTAADGPHPPDVARVVPVVRRCVHEHELAVLERCALRAVVTEPDVRSCGHDRLVRGSERPAAQEHELRDRCELVLHHACRRRAHRLEDSGAGESPGLTQHVDLHGALHAAELVEGWARIADVQGRELSAQCFDERRLTGRRYGERVGERLGARFEIPVARPQSALGRGERREHDRREAPLDAATEAGRQLVEWTHLVGPGERENCFRQVGAQPRAGLSLGGLVAAREVDHRATVADVELEIGIRDFQPGEVVEVVVLPEGRQRRWRAADENERRAVRVFARRRPPGVA